MDLPKIPKDQLPEEIQEQIEGDTAEFEALGSPEDLIQKKTQKKSERQMQKTIDELTSLNNIFKKRQKMTEKEFNRKVKKNQRYYKSSLYDIKKLFSATAIVNVKKDSFFVQGHFPGQPVMPGVLIVEAFGQAAAALTAAGIDKKEYENKLVFLMTVDKARFRSPVIPDCKLELNIEAIRSHGRVWKYKGDAFVEGKKVADAQWSATIVDRK